MVEYSLCTCVDLGTVTFWELDILPSRVHDTSNKDRGTSECQLDLQRTRTGSKVSDSYSTVTPDVLKARQSLRRTDFHNIYSAWFSPLPTGTLATGRCRCKEGAFCGVFVVCFACAVNSRETPPVCHTWYHYFSNDPCPKKRTLIKWKRVVINYWNIHWKRFNQMKTYVSCTTNSQMKK